MRQLILGRMLHCRSITTIAALREDLLSRPSNIIYDYLCPTPSHLLDVSLTSFLPELCVPIETNASKSFSQVHPSGYQKHIHDLLPQGHHIVYFPPPTLDIDLLNDGTDSLHSPKAPNGFSRRMWAGGSLDFQNSLDASLHLDGSRAICVETIQNVTIKGFGDDEKLFVSIDRLIGKAKEDSSGNLYLNKLRRIELEKSCQRFSIRERKNLVFLKQKKAGDAGDESSARRNLIKAPRGRDFSVTLTPTPSLLFRFSALTFNAHKIHLDVGFSRDIEGHRNLLVHGPLALVLMLAVLRSQLMNGEVIKTLDYRNLAPLYVDEKMTVCVRRGEKRPDILEVWIEGKNGQYAAKGSASTASSPVVSSVIT